MTCPICGHSQCPEKFRYDAAPKGEVSFGIFPEGRYFRRYFQCGACAHYFTDFRFPEKALYEGDYVAANYQGLDGIRKTFARIRGLAPEKSDNVGRVAYIDSFATARFTGPKTCLDVGSGLGIFPFAMKERGWKSHALDPDPTACEHMRTDLGLETFCQDFFCFQSSVKMNLVTFNKVLEHVVDPIAMLRKARELLTEDGLIYVELPDGEEAGKESKEREEFFVDHLHVFSAASYSLLAEKAGMALLAFERLREPSTKYTLRGFLEPQ